MFVGGKGLCRAPEQVFEKSRYPRGLMQKVEHSINPGSVPCIVKQIDYFQLEHLWGFIA